VTYPKTPPQTAGRRYKFHVAVEGVIIDVIVDDHFGGDCRYELDIDNRLRTYDTIVEGRCGFNCLTDEIEEALMVEDVPLSVTEQVIKKLIERLANRQGRTFLKATR